MSASLHKFEVGELINMAQNWDKLIAADLIGEMETTMCEKAQNTAELREYLAIKGYRQLHERLLRARVGKHGNAALVAMANASRAYAKERPGLSAATFRTPITESVEKIRVGEAVRAAYFDVFAECGYEGEAALHGVRIVRSLVRGFVVNEMSGSFIDTESTDEAFRLALEVFIRGLPALNEVPLGQGRDCEKIRSSAV